MNLFGASFTFLLTCFLITSSIRLSSSNPTHFTPHVSINCGSTKTLSAPSGRAWLGDIQSRSSSLLQIYGLSTTSTAVRMLSSADPLPHKTARISRSRFSYAFQVSPGQKIIRLHFNPTPYKGFKGLKDLFTVEAASFTLLANFSTSLTAHALGVNTFAKEFCLNILENQQLNITFSPETSQSLDTYAFINGIEIISVPAALSYFQGRDFGLQVVGQNSLVYVDNSIALEIIYRLNTQQDLVSEQEVSDGNSISWRVCVDVGFRYLVRLHFSKLGLKMAESGGLDFKVLINEMIADTNTDIVVKERYGDYMVMMNGNKQEGGKHDLLIRLQSNEEFEDGHRLEPLKGFEVLKLSNPDHSLASPNPLPPSQDSRYKTIQTLLAILGYRNAIGTVFVAIVSLLSMIAHQLREYWEDAISKEDNRPSARAERLCRRFSLSEIQLATRNFNDRLVIGMGGFGIVYKGLIDKGQKTVAIKRLKSNSKQGAHEFLTEIETLSELRHINLVSLIGYCSERGEMILVYEYMARGTLGDHLYKHAADESSSSRLTWKQRLSISIGAARGLDYLHTKHGLIHRDVKASNILLDEDFTAKVSDFGLAKLEDRSKLQSHVSTKVKGTHGYLDPYYFCTRKLTRNSDTYAFGVVLLEVLCGRAAVDWGVSEDERILAMWARHKISNGEVDQIVASILKEEISANSLKAFLGVAEKCLDEEPKNRPTMSQVVLQLESALEQQDNNQNSASVSDEIHPLNSNDGIDQSTAVQQTVDSTDMQQNLVLSTTNQTDNNNADLISTRKHGRKSTRNKPSRIWPWDAFWNRVKPSKKNYLSLSEKDFGELHKFDWGIITAATNHFSSSNKVGQGGFGSVYKAVLPSGELVAVKRHFTSSRQGLQQFKNKISLLQNLQHRNIIKLLGYCIYKEETLLVYEFMEYLSLDKFIGEQLEWAARFKIIMGIARGLVYLHQDSGLMMVHTFLNPGNILLDTKINPKISFGNAKFLVECQPMTMDTTQTFGPIAYMPLEYLMHRKCSDKTDVYSFGIILLEIVSGWRMFAPDGGSRFLIEHAWKVWNEMKSLFLADGSVGNAFDETLRCIHVALLCIQEHHDRPSMSCVIQMLEGKEVVMQPKPPPMMRDPPFITEYNSGSNSSLVTQYNSDDGLHENPGERRKLIDLDGTKCDIQRYWL